MSQEEWKEDFRKQYDHDNPNGKALVIIEDTTQYPAGKLLEDFISQTLEKELKKQKEEIASTLHQVCTCISWDDLERLINKDTK